MLIRNAFWLRAILQITLTVSCFLHPYLCTGTVELGIFDHLRYPVESSGLCSDTFKLPLQIVTTLHFSCASFTYNYQEHIVLHRLIQTNSMLSRAYFRVLFVSLSVSLGSVMNDCVYGLLFILYMVCSTFKEACERFVYDKKSFYCKLDCLFRFNDIRDKLTPYLKKCGFNPKTDIFYIPVSGLTGINLKDCARDICPWYE